MNKKIGCLLIISILLISGKAYCYQPQITHRRINEKALEYSAVNNFLINKLGYLNGTEEVVGENKIGNWLENGGTDEDVPDLRGAFHFHDPTKSWSNAGILSAFYSSINWAHNKTGDSTVPDCSNIIAALDIACTVSPPSTNPEWSWATAYDSFYKALTLKNPLEREINLANTFLTLGHIMHLLADSAVPEHARNDQHMIGESRFEQRVEEISSFLSDLIDKNISLHPADYKTITSVSNVPGYSPISNFWDTTPGLGYGGTLLGLAEYTNYNFLSPDTIFTRYSYPSKSQLGFLEVVAADNRIYFSSKTIDGKPIAHFVAAKFLWDDLQKVSTNAFDYSKFLLDDKCHDDYAAILVPKAASYDRELLNYFFRGDISLDFAGDSSNQFVIKNKLDEKLTGDFYFYYDDKQGNRIPISPVTINTDIAANGESAPLEITVPASPDKYKYIVVFKGEMGNEKDAVAGRVLGWFREEWDNGLKGNHPWLYSGMNNGNNPWMYGDQDLDAANGWNFVSNTVSGGKLTKESHAWPNMLHMGVVNQTLLHTSYKNPAGGPEYDGVHFSCKEPDPTKYCYVPYCSTTGCYTEDFGTEFPIAITEDTWLSLKIDEMTQNVPTTCPNGDYPAYQGIRLGFETGPGKKSLEINFTLPGNEDKGLIANANVIVPQAAQDYSVNLYNLLTKYDEVTPPISLNRLRVIQEMRCGSDVEHHQHMVVDYIRLIQR